MKSNGITFIDFQTRMRDAVCDAMDNVVRDFTGNPLALGITDKELPLFFPALDVVIKATADHINTDMVTCIHDTRVLPEDEG